MKVDGGGANGGRGWGMALPEDDDDGDSKMPIECQAALSVEAAEKKHSRQRGG